MTVSGFIILIAAVINKRRMIHENIKIQNKISFLFKIISLFSVLLIFESLFNPYRKYGLSINILFYNMLAVVVLYYTDKYIFPKVINIKKNDASVLIARYQLTNNELLVTLNVGRGLLNKEIAYKINRSEDMVKKHLNSIFKKMNIKNRYELISLIKQYDLG